MGQRATISLLGQTFNQSLNLKLVTGVMARELRLQVRVNTTQGFNFDHHR
jgi:hypothetical protein